MTLLLPATQEICATITEELEFAGGRLTDRFDNGRRLFLRALLPLGNEVLPQDYVEGGIAVRSVGQDIQVCPYLFRQVCKNGAVMPQVAETQRVSLVDFAASSEAIEAVHEELREAVRACSAEDVFARATRQIRLSADQEISGDVSEMVRMLLWRRLLSDELLDEIVESFLDNDDRSAFGLMNAVTSVGRDQKDPEVRWRLEELGGGVPAMSFPHVRPDVSASRLAVAEA